MFQRTRGTMRSEPSADELGEERLRAPTPAAIDPVPELTATVASAPFPRGNRYLAMRDTLGTLFTDQDFADLFLPRGQPTYPPWRLALGTVLQFAEVLSERQAADAVRAPPCLEVRARARTARSGG